MNKYWYVAGGVVVLLLAGWFLLGQGVLAPSFDGVEDSVEDDNEHGVDDMHDDEHDDDAMMEHGDDFMDDQPPSGSEGGNVTITYTKDGYSPKEVTVSAGTKVTFVNNSSDVFWPATAMHPTHTVYPGSGIAKCETEPEELFDACKRIGPSGTYSFTFNEVGTWNYHDHWTSSKTGTVIVQ